ncbi:hypothetical protein Adu01nite_87650 [Paractinoplanes durhamensis]|uniref:Uncharacterized protein n=1 Tax=Paractinoplanes durhamensis TaxID=113563 RepID=A0ABQ3ZC86_9ACTN|nr:hypothetical protein Adu01nite_87650 [Actinoplanes durhamensis]
MWHSGPVTDLGRWRPALPLTTLSLLLFLVVGVRNWPNWTENPHADERALLVLFSALFALAIPTSLSIALTPKIKSIPWVRVGAVTLLLALGLLAAVIRDIR